VAPEISGEAVKLLVTAHQNPKNKLKISAVALKIGGEQGLSELNDLALLTGATVLGEVAGRPLPSLTAQDLGWAGRIEADKKELFVVNGRGDRRAIRERITAWQGRLNTLLADAPEREALRRRLTRLSGSAGILKIGAHTKPERAVLRQKAEQGIKVLAATLVEGVVPGGGVAYIRAATRLEPHGVADPDERLGWLAVKQALSAPFFRILQNGHVPAPAVILNRLLAAGPDQVYDVVQGKLTSAREAGILDAAQIARRVLESAASGALMALSVDVTVLKRRPVTNVDYEP
jgi:chaperonin GroEL